MLGILIDAAVIIVLVNVLNEGEMTGWGTAIGVALAVGLGFLACAHFLYDYLGFFCFVPMALVAGLLLFIACDVPIKRAMIGGVILLVYKIGLGLLFIMLLS